MKKHLSVLMLFVRSSIYAVIATIILIAAVQTGLLLWTLQSGVNSLEDAMESNYLWGALVGGTTLLVAILYRMSGSKYTMRRLRISERTVFLWQSLYHFCCFALLWMTEVCVMTALCQYYLAQPVASSASNQALFLAFYRNDFLHSVLPLEEISRWICLFAEFVALAFVTAAASVRQRYDRNQTPLKLFIVLVLWFFKRPLGSVGSDVLLSLLYLTFSLYSLWDVWFNAEEVATDEMD